MLSCLSCSHDLMVSCSHALMLRHASHALVLSDSHSPLISRHLTFSHSVPRPAPLAIASYALMLACSHATRRSHIAWSTGPPTTSNTAGLSCKPGTTPTRSAFRALILSCSSAQQSFRILQNALGGMPSQDSQGLRLPRIYPCAGVMPSQK